MTRQETGLRNMTYRKLWHKYKKMEIEIRKGTEASINRNLDSFIQELSNLVIETKQVFDKYQFSF